MVKAVLENSIKEVVQALGLPEVKFTLEHPTELAHGDYATNVSLAIGKQAGRNPKELAEQIASKLTESKHQYIEKIEVAGPGFINFYLSSHFFAEGIKEILDKKDKFGWGTHVAGLKTMVEYTDPNPFKEFHIGHLMANTIGEAISRVIDANGAEVKRACYQGDTGIHIAMSVWALLKNSKKPADVKDLAAAYVEGSRAFKEDETAKMEITELNKKIFDRSDDVVNKVYDLGRQLSLDYFSTIYDKLGTKFDFNFFESESGQFGAQVVRKNIGKVFEESEGAVIFPGEKYGLHTRVFINSQGLPTYEAKELGLAQKKFEAYPYDYSVVITGNEVNDYFKVLLKAMELIYPELAKKTRHVSHGMLRLPSGKMSSRTGEVITAESLLDKVDGLVKEKIAERELTEEEKRDIATQVAVGAIKYSILKQATGRDIIFDFDKSLSFEGDSGPYLQYAHTRTQSILSKATEVGVEPRVGETVEINEVARLVYRLPEVVERAGAELAPQYIVTYLTEIAGAFSSWYAKEKIIDKDNDNSAERVALTLAVGQVLRNGLHLLGISAPEKM
jgi:arginyl-tRNA synthetase